MSIAALLRVKNELDIIEVTVRHLAGQVDEIFVADNLSTDGTRELLHSLADDLPLHVSHDDVFAHYMGPVITELAHDAWNCGHGWVVPTAADEIWFGVRERILTARVGTQQIRADVYDHVPTLQDDAAEPNPVARMEWRKRDPNGAMYPSGRFVCRVASDLVIGPGCHSAVTRTGRGTETGLEMRHFPSRTEDQFVRKAVNGKKVYEATDLPAYYGVHWRAWGTVYEQQGEQALRDLYQRDILVENPEDDPSLVYDPVLVAA